jgi:aromatic-amino-acid transaminase
LFSKFAAFAGDPILSLQQTYVQDERKDKVNLSIGIYHDEAGRIPRLDSVQRAQALLQTSDAPCVYQPMAGAACQAAEAPTNKAVARKAATLM